MSDLYVDTGSPETGQSQSLGLGLMEQVRSIILLCGGHTSSVNIICKYALHLLLGTDTSSDMGKNSWW